MIEGEKNEDIILIIVDKTYLVSYSNIYFI